MDPNVIVVLISLLIGFVAGGMFTYWFLSPRLNSRVVQPGQHWILKGDKGHREYGVVIDDVDNEYVVYHYLTATKKQYAKALRDFVACYTLIRE